jgi:hypothetical protein
MDSTVIDRVLRRNCGIYRGIFACDELPNITMRPSVVVVNTDRASQPGRHWICMYFGEGGYGEYFDSFGLQPNIMFERYMNIHCYAWTFNKKQMQSLISRFCGHYCIWYCIMKFRNVSLKDITCSMSSDTGLNDFLVHRFACKLI